MDTSLGEVVLYRIPCPPCLPAADVVFWVWLMKNISKAQWYTTWDLIFVPWLPVMGIFWVLGIRHSELLQIMFQGLTRTHASREIFLWEVSLLMMAFCSNLDFKTRELILGCFFFLSLVWWSWTLSVYWYYTIPNVWFLASFFLPGRENPWNPSTFKNQNKQAKKTSLLWCSDKAFS